MKTPDKLYRYKNVYGELVLQSFPVKRATLAGVWIQSNPFKIKEEKWVSLHSKKRFAYPTKEQALRGFITRTERHIRLETINLNTFKESLVKAIKYQNELEQSIRGNMK